MHAFRGGVAPDQLGIGISRIIPACMAYPACVPPLYTTTCLRVICLRSGPNQQPRAGTGGMHISIPYLLGDGPTNSTGASEISPPVQWMMGHQVTLMEVHCATDMHRRCFVYDEGISLLRLNPALKRLSWPKSSYLCNWLSWQRRLNWQMLATWTDEARGSHGLHRTHHWCVKNNLRTIQQSYRSICRASFKYRPMPSSSSLNYRLSYSRLDLKSTLGCCETILVFVINAMLF